MIQSSFGNIVRSDLHLERVRRYVHEPREGRASITVVRNQVMPLVDVLLAAPRPNLQSRRWSDQDS
jgi:hypothetical protein